MKDEAFDFRTFHRYQCHLKNSITNSQNNFIKNKHLSDNYQLPYYNYAQKLITMTSTSSTNNIKNDNSNNHLNNNDIENDVIDDGVYESMLLENNLISQDEIVDENIFNFMGSCEMKAQGGNDNSPSTSESVKSCNGNLNFLINIIIYYLLNLFFFNKKFIKMILRLIM